MVKSLVILHVTVVGKRFILLHMLLLTIVIILEIPVPIVEKGILMRSIEFKAKRKGTGEWVYGYYYFDGSHWIIGLNRYEIDQRTLGQYIGINDKNKTKIYEGDYVRIRDVFGGITYEGIVSFQNGSFFVDSGFSSHYRWLDYEVEVLWNIDDRELGRV